MSPTPMASEFVKYCKTSISSTVPNIFPPDSPLEDTEKKQPTADSEWTDCNPDLQDETNTDLEMDFMAPPTDNPYDAYLFDEFPLDIMCPFCRHVVMTVTRSRVSTVNMIVAFGICIMGGCLGCCLVPFCMRRLNDIYHYCPNCKKYVGRYDKLQWYSNG